MSRYPEYQSVIVETPIIIEDERLFDGEKISVSFLPISDRIKLYHSNFSLKRFTASDYDLIQEGLRKKYPSASNFRMSFKWDIDTVNVGIVCQI